jgi:RNA polymerase sigma factor (sigma-70 family)
MEVSALKYQPAGGLALHGRSPLLRLQSDERLITAIRRGNAAAFEVLVARYQSRLLSFCRHMLGSREDAEDVLQEVMAAAFGAIVADERPIQVRPWLYRIARNRSLNHLRKRTAIGVDTMDTHLAEHGATTADKVGEREEFRALVGDIQHLPETQRTALVLREMDALSYEQIAEAMETTVSSVKSLLVRARVSLAEAAEARLMSCEEVRMQLAEVAEGLQKRPSPLVRRHLKECKRCAEFQKQLKANNKALAALLPVGPLVVLRKLALLHFGHGAGAAGGASAGGSSAAAGAAAAGGTATATGAAGVGGALAGSGMFGGGSIVSAGFGAVATKAAAGLAATAVVAAGAVAADHHPATPQPAAIVPAASAPEPTSTEQVAPGQSYIERPSTVAVHPRHVTHAAATTTAQATTVSVQTSTGTAVAVAAPVTTSTSASTPTTPAPGRVATETDPTVLPPTTTTPAPPIGIPVTTTPTTSTVVATTPVTGAPTAPTSTTPVTTTPVATAPVTTAPVSTAPVTTAPGAPTATAPTTPVTTVPTVSVTVTTPAPTTTDPVATPTDPTPTDPTVTTPTTPIAGTTISGTTISIPSTTVTVPTVSIPGVTTP